MQDESKHLRVAAGERPNGRDMDETSRKIIDATMSLVRDKGYVATTTKDIARLAEVNECTLFRKFENKKDIVMHGLAQEKWRANVNAAVFQHLKWELQPDLELFMNAYMERIALDFVNLSIGLRAPRLYADTTPMIMKVPRTFLEALTDYLKKMAELGKIAETDFASMVMTIFSSTFGYTFLKASFGQALSKVEQETFIRNSVELFVEGIAKG